MKHILTFTGIFCILLSASAQDEVGPIGRMTYPGSKTSAEKITRANNPLDSTFYYLSDTIELPFFDEFSVNHFQQYDASFSDPGITEILVYKLLDPSDNPLPANTVLTSQPTYRTEVNTETNTSVNFDFTAVPLKNGNFTAYPVSYTSTSGYPPYIIIDTISFANEPDTIWIEEPEFTQDSARIFQKQLDDPASLWLDHYAYHNYTLPIDPWSLGVASFDGLDENGFPYAFGTTTSGVADFLTSKPIDLSGFLAEDSLFISFLVQRGGYGDVPEANDSLVLEFLNTNTGNWQRFWSFPGGTDIDQWHIFNLPVLNEELFTSAFQFRFKNYAGLSGSLDHFHIDYVNFHEDGGIEDSITEDFAWTYPVGSLVKDYTSVPWDHWKNNFSDKMNDKVKVSVHNSHLVARLPDVSELRVTNPETGTGIITLSPVIMTANDPENDYNALSTIDSLHDVTAVNQFSPSVTGDEATFFIKGIATIQQATFPLNDTCYATQFFSDYYAYDDGTAEKGYGVTAAQGRLAIKYTSYEEDSLIGVRMHFFPSVDDVSEKLFMLTVWADESGHPGEVLYEDNIASIRTPHYEEGYNQFTDYYLMDTMKLAVPQTFYVGWRQIDPDRLNVGFDMNNDNSDKIFYSINGGFSWQNANFDGSAMIRPVFSTEANVDLAVDEIEQALPWEVYPNPTGGAFSVNWKHEVSFPGAVCRDVQGRLISQLPEGAESLSFDLSDAPAGIYFVELAGPYRSVKKVVKY